MKVGKLVFNRNQENYFAEVEQVAYAPSTLVQGISSFPDKMLQARLFSHHDTHIHRLGPNYHLIHVNSPKNVPETSYQRDGFMRTDASGGGPNYWPNSFGGSTPDIAASEPPFEVTGIADRHPYTHPNNDVVQPGNLYCDVMTDMDREHLVGNVVDHLGGAQKRIQLRQVALFYNAEEEYGSRVAEGLGLDVGKVENLAGMTKEERERATSR